MKKNAKRIDKILLLRQKLETAAGERIPIKKFIYFRSNGGNSIGFVDFGGKELEEFQVKFGLNELEERLEGLFIRTHREYLIGIDRVAGVTRKYENKEGAEQIQRSQDFAPVRSVLNEGMVCIKDFGLKIPLTKTYSRAFKKLFGLKNLHYLVPEHPEDKRLRKLGLVDFGWRELNRLDISNQAAVDTFRKKWDMNKFSEEKMLAYFRKVGSNVVDKRRMTQNFLLQLHRWIQKGIEAPVNGNIRSLWYRIKPLLDKYSGFYEKNNSDLFYDALHEMIDDHKCFKYKDFGLFDVNDNIRNIGKKRPEVVLVFEKEGLLRKAFKMSSEVDCTFICLKGEPAMISMEYFADELHETLGKSPEIEVYTYVDIDDAGHSIKNNFLIWMKRHGITIKKVFDLVDIKYFKDKEIEVFHNDIGKYTIKNGVEKPVKPSNKSRLTKVLKWYKEVMGSDPRLIEQVIFQGEERCTIYGLESDIADYDLAREEFHREIGFKA